MTHPALEFDTKEGVEYVRNKTRLSPNDNPCRLCLSCEHASARLPEDWSFSKDDQRLIGTHWQCDIGARDLTLELLQHIKGGKAVLSTATRLLVDVNRTITSDTLFRKFADGVPIDLNHDAILSDEEKSKRLNNYYFTYHNKIQDMFKEFIDEGNQKLDKINNFRSKEAYLFSIHSFTPNFEDQPKRNVEVGILYDTPEEGIALRLYEKIKATGEFVVELNQPYSAMANSLLNNGYKKPTFAAQVTNEAGVSHSPFTWLPFELETRQDLVVQPEWRKKLVKVLVEFWTEELAITPV